MTEQSVTESLEENSSYTEEHSVIQESKPVLKQQQSTLKRTSHKDITISPISTFQTIDTLQQYGIQAADIQKLRDGGIYTLEGCNMRTHKQLSALKGLSDAKVDKIMQILREQMFSQQFSTAAAIGAKRRGLLQISTGSMEFDGILGGGIESQQICEAFGEFRTGKSQLAHSLAVTGQHPKVEGVVQRDNYKIIYIDTEATFRPQRIEQIARHYGADIAQTLENIVVARVFTHEQQMAALRFLPQLLAQGKYSMIIIDSITALFRQEFIGRAELADRQQKLNQHLAALIKIAQEFNIVVFVTNQVQATVDGSAMFTNDPKKPIGGHILAHASTTRLSLRKGRGDTRIVKIYDSPCLPELEAVFQISDGGITDAAE